jgi:Recombinase
MVAGEGVLAPAGEQYLMIGKKGSECFFASDNLQQHLLCFYIMKGTMSEAELFVLRARLQGGILNKARRGALKLPLPIGLCYTEGDGIVLDPDLQVQATIREVFQRFQHTGSAFATVRHFHQEHIPFPRRLRRGPHQGELAWGAIEHHDVLGILHHPAYAGAYVFGRTRSTKTADGKVHIEDLPRTEWVALVRNAHVGYITWEDYERNEAQLAVNSQAYAPQRLSPPREGPALFQGLIQDPFMGPQFPFPP